MNPVAKLSLLAATGAAVGAVTDWRVILASGVGSFLAFIAHRTLAIRDVETRVRASLREDIEAAISQHVCPFRSSGYVGGVNLPHVTPRSDPRET